MLKNRVIVASTLLLGALFGLSALAQEKSTAPADAVTYIVSPADGAVVTSPVTVIFGLDGMGVAPAGINVENTGHHHLIIDAPLPDLDLPVPADDHYRHFGKGQTQVTIALDAGEHTLQLLLGDWLHIPHDKAVASEPITITVH